MNFSTDLFLEYKKRPGRPSLARLLECHQDAVYSLCRQVLRQPQDAEDACQEVLLEVSRQVDAIQEPDRFSGWLYRTAIHTALDLKRKRSRQKIREAGARGSSVTETAAPESNEALHRGLAGLDDTSRMLVVEHYFARRPLRELAAERGCSEVAVWKRIQSARERLKKSLGAAALAALEGIVKVRAPAGLLGKALGPKGGLAMAAKLAIAVPLVLLAGAGLMVLSRHAEDPPPKVVKKSSIPVPAPVSAAAARSGLPDPPAFSAPAVRPASERTVGPRKPYPLKPSSLGASNAAVHAWSILSSKRVTLDEQNEPLPKVLKKLADLTGLVITLDPGVDAESAMGIKVQDIVTDGCLRLMLIPRGCDYEIRSDGSLLVGPRDGIAGGFEREGRKFQGALQELDQVRQLMDGGWDGVRNLDDPASREAALRAKKITIPQGESTLQEELRRLREVDGLSVQVDVPLNDSESFQAWQAMMSRRFLQVVEEKSVGAHLELLAQKNRLVAVGVHGYAIHLTTEEKAAAYRAEDEKQRRVYEESTRILEKPLQASGLLSVSDLLDSISLSHGLPVAPSEEVWESGATLSLSAGITLRQGLDRLKAEGFRWAVRDGKIFVLR